MYKVAVFDLAAQDSATVTAMLQTYVNAHAATGYVLDRLHAYAVGTTPMLLVVLRREVYPVAGGEGTQ